MVQLILEGLDELWHYESDLLVTELGQLLNREKSDFDVTELSVQQSERFFRCHVLSELLVLKLVVAVVELLLVGKVHQPDVNGKLVDIFVVLQNVLDAVFLNFSLRIFVDLAWIVFDELLDLIQGLGFLLDGFLFVFGLNQAWCDSLAGS